MNSHRRTAWEPPEAATADPYRANAFRLSGLPVDATARQVRRRLSELEAAKRLGAELPAPGGIRPVAPHPGPDAVIEALTRLRDPSRRLWDELLWLWPPPGGDYGYNTLLEARDRWQEMSTGSPEARSVALHNIAVVDHIAALEWDPSNGGDEPGDWETARRLRTKITKKWHSAYRNWRELVADGQCRARLESRVEAIGDPRLRTGAVDGILDRLPELVLRTHAAVAVAAAPSGHHVAAQHAELMRGSGFDAATVDRILVEACEPHVDRLRGLCRHSRDIDAGPQEWARAAARLDEETRRGADLRVPRALLGPDHRVTSGIQDELASCTRRCVVAEANDTMHDNSAERLERLTQGIEQLGRARQLATAPHIRQQIDTDTTALLSNLVIGTIDLALAEADLVPEYGLLEQENLLAHTADPLERLTALDPDSADRLRTEVAFAAHELIVGYVNETGDAFEAEEPIRKLLLSATDTRLRANVTKTFADLRLMQAARPYDVPAPRPAHRSEPRPRSPSAHPGGWCLFCGLGTGQTRTIVLQGIDEADTHMYDYTHREFAVASCGDCGQRRLRLGGGSWLFGVLGPIALLLIIGFNLGPDWQWGLMWIPIWLLGFPALFAWRAIYRISQARHRLWNDSDVAAAFAKNWRYYSG